jgi:HD-like signal output (HDOD) protein/prolyl-tRNA editing enzyme YbaK/EbsC (Cys-tRNA(Pro) deacylase)
MNIPSTVRSFLANSRGRFKGRQTVAAETFEATVALADIPLERVVKPVLLKSGKAYLMAIVRGDQQVDLAQINRLFRREFSLCSPQEIAELMPNCDPQALPPLAEPYGLRAIQDKSIAAMEKVYFATGVAGLFISASAEDYARLQESTWKKHLIAKSEAEAGAADTPHEAMRRKVRRVNELPAMPGIATELIRLKNNPYAHASELAAVIEQDPSLSAQLIRYATSPLYAYQGKVDSVEQAIVRVLGMDFVQDIAFGLALGKAFNNPKEGPLGLNAFWKHAVYCAALTQSLCNAIEFTRRPPAGMGYLAGLLHNFGILLLGHLFPAQFERLNRALEENPGRSIIELERETIGVSHTELGLWLMDAWDMPKEIVEAVTEHHNAEHRGDFATYANLVYIANALLKRHGMGDAESMEIPAEMLQRFGLTEVQLEAALGSVLQDQEGLEFMASKMAA